MGRKTENAGFACVNCGKKISPIEKRGIRNHCPFCLHSLHVDIMPGDRLSDCGGLMQPIFAKFHSQKGWQVIHKCVICDFSRPNMVSDDDDWQKIINLTNAVFE